MTRQMVFDLTASEAARDEGMDRASVPSWYLHLMASARLQAQIIARSKGTVNADDVVKHFADQGIDLTAKLGNSMGSMFRGAEWEWTGEYVKSARVHAHANLLRVWRLR